MTFKQQQKSSTVSAWKPTVTPSKCPLLKGGDLIQIKPFIGSTYKVCSAFDSAIAEGSNPIAVFQDLSRKGKACFWLEKQTAIIAQNYIILEDNSVVKFHGQYFTLSHSKGAPQLQLIAAAHCQLNSLDEIKMALLKARTSSAKQAKQHYPLVRSRGVCITAEDKNGLAVTRFEGTKFTSKHQLEKAIRLAKTDSQIETICLSGGYDGLNSIASSNTVPLVSQFSLAIWSRSLGYLDINAN